MLSLGHGKFRIDGIERMRQRPIGDLVLALNNLGAQISGERLSFGGPRSICPPLEIQASGLHGGKTKIRGDISSQFLSGLLMSAPYASESVEIFVDGPLHSKPYIDLTIGVMADFGIEVKRDDYSRFFLTPQKYKYRKVYPIESDASTASYFFAAPVICGGWVEVNNISKATRQGDIGFLEVLTQMGCEVTEGKNSIRVTGPDKILGVDVDMSDISDTAMTLAAIAPFAETPTTIRGIASSRFKETDRISATITELRRMGVQVDEYPDGMMIYPCKNIRSARIQTYDDHRIAMAFALIGLCIPGVEIQNPNCVSKTFPDYFKVLESLL